MSIGCSVDSVKGQDRAGTRILDDGTVLLWVLDGCSPAPWETEESVQNLVQSAHDWLLHGDVPSVNVLYSLCLNLDLIEANSTSTVTIATIKDDIAVITALGDSPALYGSQKLIHPEFVGVEEDLVSRVMLKVLNGVSPDEAYSSFSNEISNSRSIRNTPDGKWVLGPVPDNNSRCKIAQELSNHAHQWFLKVDEHPLVLATDGAERLFDWCLANLDEIPTANLSSLWVTLREVEKEDNSRVKYPRFSMSDDASLAWYTSNKLD